MTPRVAVRRLDYGYFVRPAEETGTGVPRVEPVLGYLVDHPDGRLLLDTGMGRHPELDGDSEVLAGVHVVVRGADGVVVVLAGQAHATAYGADALAWRARREGHEEPLPLPPAWVGRLQALDPAAVHFAHDHAVWQP